MGECTLVPFLSGLTVARRRKIFVAPGPTLAERELFRTAVADAMPLSAIHGRANLEPAPPAAIVKASGDDGYCVPVVWVEPHTTLVPGSPASGDELTWLRPGLPRKLLTDLRRNRWRVEDGLDLHGLDRDAARDQLITFIAHSLMGRLRCVRIVHGQGSSTLGRESVLKSVVRRWLAHRPEVLAYCQAPSADGGAGAVWVLLRRGR
ncbi:MAG: Smr/MutS family protein [Sterolibacterium sp.]|jgi:DNA-nicking Smr family endonuclease|nr:Smr/MutS family protein [Sterolibacterium sp.]